MLIGSPTAGGITLLVHEVESVFYGPQVLRVPQYQICLSRGAQRVYVTVGVLSRQHIFTLRERIEEFLVEEQPLRQFKVACVPAALICEELILWKGVALVPGVKCEILAIVHGRFPMRHGFGGKIFTNSIGGAAEHIQRQRIFRIRMGVDETANQLVVDVRGESILDVEFALGMNGGSVAANHAADFFAASLVLSGSIVTRQRGH